MSSRVFFILFIILLYSGGETIIAQEKAVNPQYTFKKGDPNGIGKWYMGREIAAVMSYRGMGWLERDSRPTEENTALLLANMNLNPGEVIADIGAGSGYHVMKIAPKVSQGLVYAVDIQEEMLDAINDKLKDQGINNVKTIEGSPQYTGLPENSLDKILMVDVYHEFEYPAEMMASIKNALKANGRIYLVEYRGEDPNVPIKRVHKMTLDQAVRELEAAGFKLLENKSNLPLQHFMVFGEK
ncbi:class I SAM-dependent methyltransferase [Robertkochia flava]|uniref:class I SAM-dependent methyltransferase n=1 Tax=Robertkochia flava TaxID=3447986 RepID=UPI001CCD717D|nr:class I SAM-dependent methyltransferase [Robertkochia marina]